MKIIDKIHSASEFISLEFFPPKNRDEWDDFFVSIKRLSVLNPLFVSVTYGAGGTAHNDTFEIVNKLKTDFKLTAMPHLTCINSVVDEIDSFLARVEDAGINNVLALRGDPPQGETAECLVAPPLKHASDLVTHISKSSKKIGIAVAAYPEPHPESETAEKDLEFLKQKLDAGADFAITQLFFDNKLYFDFVDKARSIGITKPIIPGILPVVSLKVIKRIVSLCGASIPAVFLKSLETADATGGNQAVKEVGIAHARAQIKGLREKGVNGIHLYTLNRPDVVESMLTD